MKNSAKLLQKFLGEAPLLIDNANKQFSGLSESQINWKPSEERWSIGECIEHLVVTHKLYNSEIRELQPIFEDSSEGSFKFKQTFTFFLQLQGNLVSMFFFQRQYCQYQGFVTVFS